MGKNRSFGADRGVIRRSGGGFSGCNRVESIVKITPAKTTEEILAALDAGNNGWKTPLQVDAANEIRRLQAEVERLNSRLSELSWQLNVDRQGGV